MSYDRPTLPEIITRTLGDISSRTQGSAYIKRSVERVLAYVLSGIAHGLHGHLEFVQAQQLPTTCEIGALLAWGALLDIPRNPATKATGTVRFAGSTSIPIDTTILGPDGTTEYIVTVGGAASGGNIDVTVEAVTAGEDGNLEAGADVSLSSPIAGVDTDGVVRSPGLSGGTDIEEVEDYRVRILEGFRTPPSGGGPGDYVAWAKKISGVTRAWEFGNRNGVGTVSLAFVRDEDADIIPDSNEVAAVQTHIEAVMPIDVNALYVQAPVELTVNITIALSPNDADTQEAVTDALTEFFAVTDLETAVYQSQIDEAISVAAGEDAHEITAITSLTPGAWELLTLGALTFTSL